MHTLMKIIATMGQKFLRVEQKVTSPEATSPADQATDRLLSGHEDDPSIERDRILAGTGH